MENFPREIRANVRINDSVTRPLFSSRHERMAKSGKSRICEWSAARRGGRGKFGAKIGQVGKGAEESGGGLGALPSGGSMRAAQSLRGHALRRDALKTRVISIDSRFRIIDIAAPLAAPDPSACLSFPPRCSYFPL